RASDAPNLSVAAGLCSSRPNSHGYIVFRLRIVPIVANIVLARTTVPGRIHRLVRGSKPKFNGEREIAGYRQILSNVHIARIVIPKPAFVNDEQRRAWTRIYHRLWCNSFPAKWYS